MMLLKNLHNYVMWCEKHFKSGWEFLLSGIDSLHYLCPALLSKTWGRLKTLIVHGPENEFALTPLLLYSYFAGLTSCNLSGSNEPVPWTRFTGLCEFKVIFLPTRNNLYGTLSAFISFWWKQGKQYISLTVFVYFKQFSCFAAMNWNFSWIFSSMVFLDRKVNLALSSLPYGLALSTFYS